MRYISESAVQEEEREGKAGRSAVLSSGTCGEEQMASLTVPELRAMAKVRGALAFCDLHAYACR